MPFYQKAALFWKKNPCWCTCCYAMILLMSKLWMRLYDYFIVMNQMYMKYILQSKILGKNLSCYHCGPHQWYFFFTYSMFLVIHYLEASTTTCQPVMHLEYIYKPAAYYLYNDKGMVEYGFLLRYLVL